MRVRIHSQGNYIKFLKQFSTRDYLNACHHSNDIPLDVKYIFWCLQFFLEDNSIWYDGMKVSLCLHVGNIIKPALLACMISWAMKQGVVLFSDIWDRLRNTGMDSEQRNLALVHHLLVSFLNCNGTLMSYLFLFHFLPELLEDFWHYQRNWNDELLDVNHTFHSGELVALLR
jgi:hypothetical protein